MNQANEQQKYQPMDDFELQDEMEMFQNEISDFLEISGFALDLDYYVSRRALVDMIVRTDKRKAYYHYFHDMTINECKVAALYAYWILKYRPIVITDNRYEADWLGLCVNESFAIYMIYATLYKVHNITQTVNEKYTYYDKLMYSFRFRHISIDAMILLVESITQDTLDMCFDKVG